MLLGVIAAFQLAFPVLNFSEYLPNLAFGRLRPVHTNAVIFAFVGNGIFTAVYYALPRLLKTPMWNSALSKNESLQPGLTLTLYVDKPALPDA